MNPTQIVTIRLKSGKTYLVDLMETAISIVYPNDPDVAVFRFIPDEGVQIEIDVDQIEMIVRGPRGGVLTVPDVRG